MSNITKRIGFTLIEILIAMGILFVTGTAVIALTNSLIQSTITSSDKTIANRWAVEGLEIVTRMRDDSVKSGQNRVYSYPWANIWFSPVFNDDGAGSYRWHELQGSEQSGWNLRDLQAPPCPGSTAFQILKACATSGVFPPLQSGSFKAYRLICINSVAHANTQPENYVDCFANSDGRRSNLTSCEANDRYCLMTLCSLNRNLPTFDCNNPNYSLNPKLINSGNSVKVRSLVIWQDRNRYYTTEVSTILTNWKTP